MRVKHAILVIASLALHKSPAYSQPTGGYPPSAFISGIPVACGGLPTISDPNLHDAAWFTGSAIIMNPNVVATMPTPMKLWAYAHECGHFHQGPDEMAADCWAIRTGRNEGWFPPQAFNLIIALFQGNPGDLHHPPGVARIANMRNCYATP